MAHKKSVFTYCRVIFKKGITFGLLTGLVLLIVPLQQVSAYTNYDDCVFISSGDLARMNGNRDLTDAEIDGIEANCHRSFPSTSPSPVNSTRTSVPPATTRSSNPQVSTSASAAPVVPASPAVSNAPSVVPVASAVPVSSTGQSSNNLSSPGSGQSGTSLGADNRPLFDRIVPPKSTDVLTPGFATQDRPSISSLVNFLFDFLVRRLLPIIAGILVIVITWGGYQYIMAQGDSGKTKQAKDTILFGIIGLVLAMAALSIVTILNNILLQT